MDPATITFVLLSASRLANKLLDGMEKGELTPEQAAEQWKQTGWNEAVQMWRSTPDPNNPGS